VIYIINWRIIRLYMNIIKRGIDHLYDEGIFEFTRATLGYPFNLYNRFKLGSGVDVMNEDWDNLILLDACRYDKFSNMNHLSGKLESRISKGSTSREFIEKNFCGRKLHDTVYITANPYIGYIEPDVFHATISLLDEWDSNAKTVKPESVRKRTIDSYNNYGDKRLIIHFMQPHQPYIGKKADWIKSKVKSETDGTIKSMSKNIKKKEQNEKIFDGKDHNTESSHSISMKKLPKNNDINVKREDIIEAYNETLEIVLHEVEMLLEHIDGKTIISADHGEMLGEKLNPFRKPKYGHPIGQYTVELRKVPWFIIESNQRRQINSDPPEKYDVVGEDILESRLKALGYK